MDIEDFTEKVGDIVEEEAEKNQSLNALLRHPDVMADVISVLFFRNRTRIMPEDLHLQGAADGTEGALERDQYFVWARRRALSRTGVPAADRGNFQAEDSRETLDVLAFFGLENVFAYDDLLPMKASGYDGEQVRRQIDAIRNHLENGKRDPLMPEDHIVPVTTIHLFYGDEKWGRVRSLWDIYESRFTGEDSELRKELSVLPASYVEELRDMAAPKSKISLFDVRRLPKETVDAFQSDFRFVAQALTNRFPPDVELKTMVPAHPRELMDVLRAFGFCFSDDFMSRTESTNWRM